MNIVEIVPKDNYTFALLKEKSEFERIHNGGYFIEWECGADLSADTIQVRWEVSSTENVQRDATADAKKRSG